MDKDFHPSEDTNQPTPAFFFFTQDQRMLLREEKPDGSLMEIAHIIRERWHKLTPSEKEPYEQLASRDRERWMRERNENISSPSI